MVEIVKFYICCLFTALVRDVIGSSSWIQSNFGCADLHQNIKIPEKFKNFNFLPEIASMVSVAVSKFIESPTVFRV